MEGCWKCSESTKRYTGWCCEQQRRGNRFRNNEERLRDKPLSSIPWVEHSGKVRPSLKKVIRDEVGPDPSLGHYPRLVFCLFVFTCRDMWGRFGCWGINGPQIWNSSEKPLASCHTAVSRVDGDRFPQGSSGFSPPTAHCLPLSTSFISSSFSPLRNDWTFSASVTK